MKEVTENKVRINNIEYITNPILEVPPPEVLKVSPKITTKIFMK